MRDRAAAAPLFGQLAAGAAAIGGNRAFSKLLVPRPRRPSVVNRKVGPVRLPAVPLQRQRTAGATLTATRFKGDLELEACLQDRARLTIGHEGPSVARIQQALAELGFDVG